MISRIKLAFQKRYTHVKTPDKVVDCRQLHDHKGPRNHCGAHPTFVSSLLKHPRFAPWLASSKETCQILRAMYLEGDEMVIALCCKHGHNRSVGLGAIVTYILEQEGYSVHKVWLSQSVMTHRQICLECCKTDSEAKCCFLRAFKDAVRLWRSI